MISYKIFKISNKKITRLTRGARPALADLQRAPLLVATKSDATVSRAKV